MSGPLLLCNLATGVIVISILATMVFGYLVWRANRQRARLIELKEAVIRKGKKGELMRDMSLDQAKEYWNCDLPESEEFNGETWYACAGDCGDKFLAKDLVWIKPNSEYRGG